MPKLSGVNHLNAVRALQKVGFRVARQGRHIVMTDGTRLVTGTTAQSGECYHDGKHRS